MGETECLISLSDYKDASEIVAAMRTKLAELNVPVVEGTPLFNAGATALRDKLVVKPGFWKKDPDNLAVILTHEVVHYCQRGLMGDNEFDTSAINSRGRVRMEIPAFRQSFITMLHIGYGEEEVRREINVRVDKVRNEYWLHDIAPAQYEKEVVKIWDRSFISE